MQAKLTDWASNISAPQGGFVRTPPWLSHLCALGGPPLPFFSMATSEWDLHTFPAPFLPTWAWLQEPGLKLMVSLVTYTILPQI